MSPKQLLDACIEAEEFAADIPSLTPGFTVEVSELRRTKSVEICKGLKGKNLGNYEDVDGNPTTHVFLKTATVRRFLREWIESRL